MERMIFILVGKGAPRILSQLHELKVTPSKDIQAIQEDLDALQRMAYRNLMSKSKIEDGLIRVMRNMTKSLGIRCALRNMK